MAYVWWLLDGTDDENNEPLHDELTMDREDATVIMRPFAKRLARTVFNRKYGRSILDSDDFFESFLTIVAYVLTTRRFFNRRIRRGNIIPGPWNRDPAPNMEVQTHVESHGSRPPGTHVNGNGHGGPPVFGSGRIPNLTPEPN